MRYNFDEVISREDTDALKIEGMDENWGRHDLLPLWIADMDFATPPFIIDAITDRCKNPVLGYTKRPQEWSDAIVSWQKNRFGWDVREEWLNFVPGIVPGIAFAIQCFTKPGDKILVTTPVYPPYLHVPRKNGRIVVECNLKIKDDEIVIDWEDFEKAAKGCSMFLLCHPHNPGGRVWTKEELCHIAEICKKNNILVVSDEIHADLTLSPFHHIPYAMSCEDAKQNSITFASPSKALNMAGMVSSYSVIPNDNIRTQFDAYLNNNELNMGHAFAFRTVIAAYTHGTEWLDQCLAYIQDNIDYVEKRLREDMPEITMIKPQASYLIFLDCKKLHMNNNQLHDFFVCKAHLALNDGFTFGDNGSGYMRLNIATPRCVLKRAIDQLAEGYKTIDN